MGESPSWAWAQQLRKQSGGSLSCHNRVASRHLLFTQAEQIQPGPSNRHKGALVPLFPGLPPQPSPAGSSLRGRGHSLQQPGRWEQDQHVQGRLCAWFEQSGLRALSCTGRKRPILQISKLRLREEPERGLLIRDGACDLDQGGSIAYIHYACLVPPPHM